MINLQHFIFTPKYRLPLFERRAVAEQLEYLIRYICRKKRIQVRSLAVMPDHVHLFLVIPRTMGDADVAHIIKWFTSIHLRRINPSVKAACPKALWGVRYFYRSVGGDARAVQKYIEDQSVL